MAENINVSTQALVETATEIRNINKTLDEKLLEVNKIITNLTSAGWESEGAENTKKEINEMKPRFDEYKKVVDTYAAFLEQSSESYVSTETAIAKNAEAINDALFKK